MWGHCSRHHLPPVFLPMHLRPQFQHWAHHATTFLSSLTFYFLGLPIPLPFFLYILVLFSSHDQTISTSSCVFHTSVFYPHHILCFFISHVIFSCESACPSAHHFDDFWSLILLVVSSRVSARVAWLVVLPSCESLFWLLVVFCHTTLLTSFSYSIQIALFCLLPHLLPYHFESCSQGTWTLLTSGCWLLSIFMLRSDFPFRHKHTGLDLDIFIPTI